MFGVFPFLFDLVNAQPSNAAVMVFFHGGGYTTGAGDGYNGLPLVAYHGVVYVSCNYRLNSLGFISTGGDIRSV